MLFTLSRVLRPLRRESKPAISVHKAKYILANPCRPKMQIVCNKSLGGLRRRSQQRRRVTKRCLGSHPCCIISFRYQNLLRCHDKGGQHRFRMGIRNNCYVFVTALINLGPVPITPCSVTTCDATASPYMCERSVNSRMLYANFAIA
jgi:hypothetical protein